MIARGGCGFTFSFSFHCDLKIKNRVDLVFKKFKNLLLFPRFDPAPMLGIGRLAGRQMLLLQLILVEFRIMIVGIMIAGNECKTILKNGAFKYASGGGLKNCNSRLNFKYL